MNDKEHSLRSIIRDYDPEPVELALAGFMFLWGARLAWPGSTFGSSASFAVMDRVAPEDAWAAVMLSVSLLKFLALRIGDHILRAGVSFIGTMIWSLIWMSITLANPGGTGVVVYISFAVLSAWVLWRNIIQTRSRTQ